MYVCHELGKTEKELVGWTVDDVIRWYAFFKLKNEAEAEAMRKANKRGGTKENTTRTVY